MIEKTNIALNDENMFKKEEITESDLETKYYIVDGEIKIKALNINLNIDLEFNGQTLNDINLKIGPNSKVKFNKASFHNCTFICENGNLTFNNCEFFESGLDLKDISSIFAMGCLFNNGSIILSDSNSYLTDVNLEGTVLSFKCGCKGSFLNVLFKDNSEKKDSYLEILDKSHLFLSKCIFYCKCNGGLKILDSSIDVNDCEIIGTEKEKSKVIFEKSHKNHISKLMLSNIKVLLEQSRCKFCECSLDRIDFTANNKSKTTFIDTVIADNSKINIEKSIFNAKSSTFDKTPINFSGSSQGELNEIIISNLEESNPISVSNSEITLKNSTLFKCKQELTSFDSGSIILFKCLIEGKGPLLCSKENGYIEAKGCIFLFTDKNSKLISTNNGSLFIAGCLFKSERKIGSCPLLYNDVKANIKFKSHNDVKSFPSFIEIKSEYWNSIKCCYLYINSENAEMFTFEQIDGSLAHLQAEKTEQVHPNS